MLARIALALVPLGPALAAQIPVHVVAPAPGPGVDFTTLQSAIDASADGDIVLVRSGSYDELSLQARAVHVVADAGAVVHITQTIEIVATTAASSCSLRGLEITPQADILDIRSCAGSVWIEDCRITTATWVESSASVGVARCVGAPPSNSNHSALTLPNATQSHVWSFESDWEGGDGFMNAFPFLVNGRSGANCVGSELYVSGGLLRGGDGAWTGFGGACTQGFAGQGAYIANDGSLIHIGVTFEGGAPSVACGLPPGGGEPLAVSNATATALAGTPRALVASSPVREGQVAQIDAQGAPGEYALVAYAPEFQLGVYASEWRAPLLVATPQRLVALGVLPASGHARQSFTIAELGAGVEGARIVAQGAFVDPVAMTVQLGSASELVALDASF